MWRKRCFRFGTCLLLGLGLVRPAQGQPNVSFYPDLRADQVREIQGIIDSMKTNPRGPYSRLRWFCNDGTVHPPRGTPCQEHGGGHQHAELSREARRLEEFGFHVGAILRGMSFEEFADSESDYLFLKEQVIQDYLFQTDHGWILRRARYYRGARQIEDEEQQGAAFLERLFARREWLKKYYLLATQLVQVLPHPSRSGSSTSRIRHLIAEAADLDPQLQTLRIKIHSFPSPSDLSSVRRMASRPDGDEKVKGILQELSSLLAARYLGEGFREESRQLSDRIVRLRTDPKTTELRDRIVRLDTLRGSERLAELGTVSVLVRNLVETGTDGAVNLLLFDLNQALQEDAFRVVQTLEPAQEETRRDRIRHLLSYFALAHGAGFLSQREVDALVEEVNAFLERRSCTVLEYKRALNHLTRSLDWSEGTERRTFNPVYQRYRLVEPETAGFFDSLIRSSNLFHLASRLARLQQDVDALIRMVPQGEPTVASRMRGLNPGIALGVLEVVRDVPVDWRPDSERIYVIPETVAELRPVAGLITLDAGNLLSHVQLLARNLDIPNATAPSDLLDELGRLEGLEVLYAVSPLGRVLLKRADEMLPSERELLEQSQPENPVKIRLEPGRVRLDVSDPIPLDELWARDSGVLSGPKAANLGELASLFPGRVAKGVVLPFGAYWGHVSRPWKDASVTVAEEIRAAFRQVRQLEEVGRPRSEINRFIFDRLAYFREAIVGLPMIDEDRERLVESLTGTFGAGLERGVFVRSDTNVEDLPQFSGAGLNLTVANLRTIPDVLEAVKKLWASPFSERAYLWRSRILDDLGAIYPSVLILESVASEKSGVLITTGLEGGPADALTVATAEGVGGAVQGEAAEMILVLPDGGVRLLSEAKAPFRRVLSPGAEGGVVYLPASGDDYLLKEGEIAALRRVAATVRERMPSEDPETVWDLEFGFVGGNLWLFQIRPFVEHRDSRSRELLSSLDDEWKEQMTASVDLNSPF